MPMMAMGVLGVQGVCVLLGALGVIYENNYDMVAGLKYIFRTYIYGKYDQITCRKGY
jgi:hypothetical protein